MFFWVFAFCTWKARGLERERRVTWGEAQIFSHPCLSPPCPSFQGSGFWTRILPTHVCRGPGCTWELLRALCSTHVLPGLVVCSVGLAVYICCFFFLTGKWWPRQHCKMYQSVMFLLEIIFCVEDHLFCNGDLNKIWPVVAECYWLLSCSFILDFKRKITPLVFPGTQWVNFWGVVKAFRSYSWKECPGRRAFC